MTDFLTAQLPLIAALQRSLASSDLLVGLWRFFTFFGNEEFFLLLLPLVYWCFSARRGLQLGVLLIVSDAANVVFKLLFASPRPYWFGEPIRALGVDVSFGMPSGHAQNAVAIWLFLALMAGRRYGRNRCLGVALALIGLISLSRVVLGMHFPSDILGGWAIGAVWLWLNLKYWEKFETYLQRRKVVQQEATAVVFVSIYVCCALMLNNLRADVSLYPGVDERIFAHSVAYSTTLQGVFTRGGTLLGLLIGMAFQYRRIRWKAVGSSSQNTARFLVGLVGVLLLWRGLAMVFPKGAEDAALILRFVRYALLTSWVVWFAPLLFLRFRSTFGGDRTVRNLEKSHGLLAAAD